MKIKKEQENWWRSVNQTDILWTIKAKIISLKRTNVNCLIAIYFKQNKSEHLNSAKLTIEIPYQRETLVMIAAATAKPS